MTFKDFTGLIGQRFGRLTAVRLSDQRTKQGRAMMECRCDCGADPIVRVNQLKNGRTQSCGCLGRESLAAAKRARRHGMTGTSVHRVWSAMRNRCENKNSPAFKNYGARGITVCDRWRIFENFLADMGEPAEGLSLDRIDNNKGYEPGNCAWATRKQQARNRRSVKLRLMPDLTLGTGSEVALAAGINPKTYRDRISRGWSPDEALQPLRGGRKTISFNGVADSITGWAERVGIAKHTLAARLRDGWTVEKALTTPTKEQYRRKT